MTLNLGSWGRKMSQNMIKDKEKQNMSVYATEAKAETAPSTHGIDQCMTIEE